MHFFFRNQVIQRIKQRLGINAPAAAEDDSPTKIPASSSTEPAFVASSNSVSNPLAGESASATDSNAVDTSKNVAVSRTEVQCQTDPPPADESLPAESQEIVTNTIDARADEDAESSTLETPSFSEESSLHIKKSSGGGAVPAHGESNLPNVLQEIRNEDVELRLSTDERLQQLQQLEPSPNPSSIHPPPQDIGGSRPITPFNTDMSCATSVSWISNFEPGAKMSSDAPNGTHTSANIHSLGVNRDGTNQEDGNRDGSEIPSSTEESPARKLIPPLPLPLSLNQQDHMLRLEQLQHDRGNNVLDSLSLSMDTVSMSASKDWYAQDDRMPPSFSSPQRNENLLSFPRRNENDMNSNQHNLDHRNDRRDREISEMELQMDSSPSPSQQAQTQARVEHSAHDLVVTDMPTNNMSPPSRVSPPSHHLTGLHSNSRDEQFDQTVCDPGKRSTENMSSVEPMASFDRMSERLSLSEDRVVPDRVSEERMVSERDVQTTDLAVVVEKSDLGVQCDQSDMLMPIKKEVSTIACQTSPRLTERELSLGQGAVVKCETCDSGCQAELLTERQQQHSIAVGTDPDPEPITGPSAASSPPVNFSEAERRGAPPRPPRAFASTSSGHGQEPLTGLSSEVSHKHFLLK